MDIPVNIWAVLIAAVVNMVLGFFWFGSLFGKQWMESAGLTRESISKAAENKSMGVSYGLAALGSLVMAYMLAVAVVLAGSYLGGSGIVFGLMVGFFVWLGFIAPVTVGVVLWDMKPWKYWVVTYGYNLVAFLLMGAILAGWM